MNCSVTDLRNKEVINTKNGYRLGCVSDVEICCESGCLCAIVIWGKTGILGLGTCEDIRIPWKDVCVVGDDTVLVCTDIECCRREKKARKNFLDGLF